ncbi:MAG: hypothetical protein WKG01_26005 [Kofleriaceae bacterium]
MMIVTAIAVLIGALSCAAEPNPFLVAGPRGEPVPAVVVASCNLAHVRCSRCHTLDRVLEARVTEPADWRRYVRRMRLMPDSAIKSAEEPALVRCLVFHTSGNAGLVRMSRESP